MSQPGRIPNPHLLADVRKAVQIRITLPSPKEIAARHGVTPRHVQRLLREAFQQVRDKVVFDQ